MKSSIRKPSGAIITRRSFLGRSLGAGAALGFATARPGRSVVADPTLVATLSEQGIIEEMTWKRPCGTAANLVFRDDTYAGFSWHVNVAGNWRASLPLARVEPGADVFATTIDDVTCSLAYTVREGCLEVVAKITNESGRDFSPERALLNIGLDLEMAQYPEWNERFSPTLLRCEKTHFWGYFMRPDGVILGIASPDPIVSWGNAYNRGGHRIFNSHLDLLNKEPQPARHPQVNDTLAPGESRQWKILLVPLDKLGDVQPALARVSGIPMISLDRPTVEEGEAVAGGLIAPGGFGSFSVVGPDEMPVSAESDGSSFSFKPALPGVYTLRLTDAAGRIAEAKASCRMPWSWYMNQARANAVSKPQKGGSHTESWYGLFSGYIARQHFPDANLDAELDAKFKEIAPLMYDMEAMQPLTTPPAGRIIHRIQNHAGFISALVARYRADGDIRNLELAASLADFLITCQSADGAYRSKNSHYTCVIYIAKSIMELMAEEKRLGADSPVWKERYQRHEDSVRRAVDELALNLANIGTEGEHTYEDGMISCSYSQLAMFALLEDDPEQRRKYLDAAIRLAAGHRCLSQILIPDSRMNGGSLRYWESQYDINTNAVNMMNSPHGWSAWRLYGLWYLYQLTGEKEYLRQAMNGLGSCVQLVDFKTGDLRWAFVPDPCVHIKLFEEIPDQPGQGRHVPRIVGEEYLPMISGWYRAHPDTWTVGYLGMADWYPPGTQGGCCDNDVHEIFKCLGEIALDSAYVFENADGSLETWNCTAKRDIDGAIAVKPAEAVVLRVHFNLRETASVEVAFGDGKQTGKLVSGMTWFGPGGIPEGLRP